MGNHDKWLQSKESGRKECAGMPLTLGFYDRDDVPFYYAIADAFTVCDQHFCSSLDRHDAQPALSVDRYDPGEAGGSVRAQRQKLRG
ncbi:MAG: alkaline phosphatase family protein [Paludibaculum sp.]